MFKRILVPTDGSEASRTAIKASLEFAKEIGANIVGLHVVPEFDAYVHGDYMPKESKERLMSETLTQAEKLLAEVEAAARAAGVACTTVHLVSDYPHEAIIKAAKDHGCDLIGMSSHGRKGIKGLLIGSETQKVLTHSDVPVLVFR